MKIPQFTTKRPVTVVLECAICGTRLSQSLVPVAGQPLVTLAIRRAQIDHGWTPFIPVLEGSVCRRCKRRG